MTFDTDGGKEIPEEQTVKRGSKAVKSEDPEKEGWIFKGWYYIDEDGKETEWDFNTPVHRNLVLKAKWERPADTNSTEATKQRIYMIPEGRKRPKKKSRLHGSTGKSEKQWRRPEKNSSGRGC